MDRDAKVEVKVSPDGVAATLSIWKGRGRGRPLELSAVSAALKASGVRGFKAEELKKDVLAFYKGQGGRAPRLSPRPGPGPGRGKGRTLVLSVALLPEDKAAELRKRLAEQSGTRPGPAEPRRIPDRGGDARSPWSSSGRSSASCPPAEPGQDGVDVFGKVLPGHSPATTPPSRPSRTSTSAGTSSSPPPRASSSPTSRDRAWRLRVVRFRDSIIEVVDRRRLDVGDASTLVGGGGPRLAPLRRESARGPRRERRQAGPRALLDSRGRVRRARGQARAQAGRRPRQSRPRRAAASRRPGSCTRPRAPSTPSTRGTGPTSRSATR